jgi:hypothetical protein
MSQLKRFIGTSSKTMNQWGRGFEDHMATDQIEFDRYTKLVDIFFKHICPSIKGKANKLDKYLENPKAAFYETYKHGKIKFHDGDDEGPDWKI